MTRFFKNPYLSQYYKEDVVQVDESLCRNLISNYVSKILAAKPGKDGDLYVGNAGISFMFLKLNDLENAKKYADIAKKDAIKNTNPVDSCSFLCGNAGIYAVSAVVNYRLNNIQECQQDLSEFLKAYQICRNINFNKNGSDELLFGRSGYLSGIYWLNQNLPEHLKIKDEIVEDLCNVIIESGVNFSKAQRSNFPLLYHCWSDLYVGAAHGISSIMHMLMASPLIVKTDKASEHKKKLIKQTVDALLALQNDEGNFPCTLDDVGGEYNLVHWCHGAPGVVYLMAKACLVYEDKKYLNACLKAGDLVWEKGLLRKGPGICHGVAGNGYVFLLLYKLTSDQKHLFRALKFVEFLNDDQFLQEARTPDRPYSLYEGLAGTVCFLADLLNTSNAAFPFMDVL